MSSIFKLIIPKYNIYVGNLGMGGTISSRSSSLKYTILLGIKDKKPLLSGLVDVQVLPLAT